MRTLGYYGAIQAITFLANRPTFKNLTWESMGKTKMLNILKTVNHRAKMTKIWDSWYYSAYVEGTFDARFLHGGWQMGSFGALCKISIL